MMSTSFSLHGVFQSVKEPRGRNVDQGGVKGTLGPKRRPEEEEEEEEEGQEGKAASKA